MLKGIALNQLECKVQCINASVIIINCRDDFDFCEVPDWIYDPEKNGGGAVMAGGVHWIRPLRLMYNELVCLVYLRHYLKVG